MLMKKILYTAVIIFAGILTGCGRNTEKDSTSSAASLSVTEASSEMTTAVMTRNDDGYFLIDAGAAKKMIDAGGVTIVDVRTAEEYAQKHIPEAINVPNESIGDEAPSELADKEAVILVYCRTGRRSADAAGKLAGLGYTNVYDFGGIVDWPYETEK